MARCHWRFIVRDAYGYALQNCRVSAFQPGTSTNFLGSAFTAPSGGGAVTNPMLTNAQGEVEAWFDTRQSIDVFVDDNADTAYRAVDGPGVVISFTAFTEADEVDVAPNDVIILIPVVGVAGDLISATVNPYTEAAAAAGATGKYADAGHGHPYTALVPGIALPPRSTAAAGDDLQPAPDDHIHKFMSALGKTAKFTKTTAAEEVVHTLTVPAGSAAGGSMFHIRAHFFQTNGTTACTFTFRVRWGGLTGVVLGTALALVGTTTAHTDTPMFLDALVTIQTIGATGTATMHMNGFETITVAVSFTRVLTSSVQAAAAVIDTTVDKDLVFTAELSTVTGAPNIEVDDIIIEQVA